MDEKEKYLGDCAKCGKKLTEFLSNKIWAYNSHLPQMDRIYFTGVFVKNKPIYRCGLCATKKMIKDQTTGGL